MIAAKHIFVPSKTSLVVLVAFINALNAFACLSAGCLAEDWLFLSYREAGSQPLAADSLTVTRLL